MILKPIQISQKHFSNIETKKSEIHTATTSNAISGNEYIVIVLKKSADINNFTEEDILYIDQKTAESGEITFNYIPKNDDESIVYIIGVFVGDDSVKQEVIITECKHNNTEIIYGYKGT